MLELECGLGHVMRSHDVYSKMVDPRWQKDFSRSSDFSRNKSNLLLFDAYLATMEVFAHSYDYENRCMLEKDLFL